MVALVAAGFVVGNLLHALALMQDGRGAYRAALAHIAATSPFAEITLTGDHDFRTGTVAAWHAPAAGEGRTVRYLPAGDLPPRGAQWYVLHRFRHDPPGPPDVVDPDGHRYVRDRTFPHAGLSGWDWVLYRNEELPR